MSLSQVASVSDEETAATTIQAHYRGYLARKQYVSRLYKQFEQVRLRCSDLYCLTWISLILFALFLLLYAVSLVEILP